MKQSKPDVPHSASPTKRTSKLSDRRNTGTKSAALGRRSWVALLAAIAVLAPASLGAAGDEARYLRLRKSMIETQIKARGIEQLEVLAALETVPRHRFVPESRRSQAYEDYPLPIGSGQTISQPYIVALMTELLELEGDERILEIGTGSGYHAAVLSRVAREVYTVEIIEPLARRAEATLDELEYDNVHVRVGDGYQGWPTEAPFDAVVLTAAPTEIPPPLIEQLKVGGRMVVPVGSFFQDLKLITKTEEGIVTKNVIPVRFVPMTGEAQKRR